MPQAQLLGPQKKRKRKKTLAVPHQSPRAAHCGNRKEERDHVPAQHSPQHRTSEVRSLEPQQGPLALQELLGCQ